MGEANEGKRIFNGMEKNFLEANRYPRDLLQKFFSSNQSQQGLTSTDNENDESEEIELSLGLSLGGRFGVDKSDKKPLMRSSSIAGSIPIIRDDDAVAPLPVSRPILIRASSLPAPTDEEWRKRKELQTLRRMEAKRRRSEKQRNLKAEKDGGGGGSERSFEERRESEVNLIRKIEREQYPAGLAVVPVYGLPNWSAPPPQTMPGGEKANYRTSRGGGGIGGVGGGGGVQGILQPSGSIESVGGGGVQGLLQPSGSIESVGGSSSGKSESESRPFPGSSSCGEASPASIQSLQEQSNQEPAGSSSGIKERVNACKYSTEMESSSKRPEVVGRRGREMGLNSMDNMPCVFTQGDGPNGRRIEGILYKYGKGEEVRIMCVCHGNFLSPAEFVRHAGGGNVAHPLKHIVVNPSSSSFL
ncbi:hypothetical protein U1Q18_016721 [Sarracenia purpurea var. burkii]